MTGVETYCVMFTLVKGCKMAWASITWFDVLHLWLGSYKQTCGQNPPSVAKRMVVYLIRYTTAWLGWGNVTKLFVKWMRERRWMKVLWGQSASCVLDHWGSSQLPRGALYQRYPAYVNSFCEDLWVYNFHPLGDFAITLNFEKRGWFPEDLCEIECLRGRGAVTHQEKSNTLRTDSSTFCLPDMGFQARNVGLENSFQRELKYCLPGFLQQLHSCMECSELCQCYRRVGKRMRVPFVPACIVVSCAVMSLSFPLVWSIFWGISCVWLNGLLDLTQADNVSLCQFMEIQIAFWPLLWTDEFWYCDAWESVDHKDTLQRPEC